MKVAASPLRMTKRGDARSPEDRSQMSGVRCLMSDVSQSPDHLGSLIPSCQSQISNSNFLHLCYNDYECNQQVSC